MERPPFPPSIRSFLDRARIAHLATADAASLPHVVPICYAATDSCVYFTIDAKPKRSPTRLRRLRNIAANPLVAIVVDRYDEEWSRLGFVQIEGLAELVATEEEYVAAMAALTTRYAQYMRMSLSLRTHPLIRITVNGWHSWGLLDD